MSRYKNGNGMTQIAIKCEKCKKTKSQETREEPSNNKAKTADLNLNGQNIINNNNLLLIVRLLHWEMLTGALQRRIIKSRET